MIQFQFLPYLIDSGSLFYKNNAVGRDQTAAERMLVVGTRHALCLRKTENYKLLTNTRHSVQKLVCGTSIGRR